MRLCEGEALAVARGEQRGFIAVAAVPHRANGMNHVFRRQFIAARDFGLTGAATFECSTLCQQSGACCTVDRTVDTAAAEQRGAGGVDDGVHVERDDIGFNRPHYAWRLSHPLKGAVGQPAFELIKTVGTPKRFVIDDEVRRPEDAARDRRFDFQFEFVFDDFVGECRQ